MFKMRFSAVPFFFLAFACLSASAQSTHGYPFRASNYEVEALLHPNDQTITVEARVVFIANEVSRNVLVELHQDLRIQSIKLTNGQAVNFERDEHAPILVNIGLPEVESPGKSVTLIFQYGGPVSNEDDSPSKGIRLASVDKTSAYLLQPARWFPLTEYPSNRYTGTFKIVVPDTFAVVGTCRPDQPTMMPAITRGEPGQAAYMFHCDKAGPVGTFVAGQLQLSPQQSEGLSIPVYTPPAQASTAAAYASSLTKVLSFYEESFGPVTDPPNQPNVTIAQMPDGSLPGFSAPGLVLISARNWSAKPNEELLAQTAAGQWWNNRVMPASLGDEWLSDGLASYASAMYAEQSEGISGLHKELENFAVGSLMFDDTIPISQSEHVDQYTERYQSIVVDKGAMVFHMLRSEMGDDAFTSLMQDFYKQHIGKTVTLAEFQKLAAAKVPPPANGDPPLNLNAFFSQWLNSTGVPEFKMDYIVYRTPKGFKVVGKIRQDLDLFRMPVEVRVDTEGNPETRKILVTGTSTEFEVDTFGRPKPNGVTIDPNNNLLKSSPKLRVRALVARGEGLAQQGKYYDAIQEYQRALDLQSNSSLALFRTGEAMFYEKNYNAAANSFRAALGGDLDPKWLEVWSHIYIGEIYDLSGQRARAVNEYQLAQHLNDNTAGAQDVAGAYIQKPYSGDNPPPASASSSSTTQPAASQSSTAPGNASSDRPTLKKRPEDTN